MLLDEPKPHDHRALGRALDLFHFEDDAPGMPFWHPDGLVLHQLLADAVRAFTKADGYAEVRTPQLLRRPVWDRSGHWRFYADAMFALDDGESEAALKPVSCPGHVLIARDRLRSYRELPLRLSELGLVHRDERSGALHGLLRVRQFTQDDGHVFCAEDQVVDELVRFVERVPRFYRAFGLDGLEVGLSLRPEHRSGSDEAWDRAEGELRAALARVGQAAIEQPGEGAFYAPKLEWSLADRHGRRWQCGTIQVDRAMPAAFGLRYTDADGARRHPVMLHRALYGSLERFLGMLLEHHGAALPPWLAPLQVLVLPVKPAQEAAARVHARRLERDGLRVRVDVDGALGRRLAQAHARHVPHVLIVGADEVEHDRLTLRLGAEQHAGWSEVVLDEVRARCRAPDFGA
jgi:threonyl-tRNA synthetase